MKRIDKEIFHCSKQIKRKYSNSWSWLLAGVVCSATLLIGTEAAWLAAITSTIGWIGVAILVSVGLYYLVGDCCRPLYLPTDEVMTRREVYFEQSQLPTLLRLLENKNLSAIESQPRSFTPELLFVTYSTTSGTLTCAQLLDNSGPAPRPISKIVSIDK